MLCKLRIKLTLTAFLAITFFSLNSSAQTQNHTHKYWPHLITLKEGKAILEAAWQHSSEVDYKPDCSHLVHEIYSLAGLDYKYVPSHDLYQGSAPFVRVSKPQPGDLIVWMGHVGIVVSAKEHSFYSSLRNGLLTDNYLTQYWRGRGRPRFYRYRLDHPALIAATLPAGFEPGR